MEQTQEMQLLQHIMKTIKDKNRTEFQNTVAELQPYDTAVLYKQISRRLRLGFLNFLTTEQLTALLQELDSEDQIDLLHVLGLEKSSHVLDLMENDDLADLLGSMSVEKIDEFLGVMKQEESQSVQNLMKYRPDTAGGIMTNRYVWIRKHFTVREAVDKLKTFAQLAENIYYLYVIDQDNVLVGVVSYRNLLLAEMDDRIEDLMSSRVIAVPSDMDQEEVARTFERYDFIALPVTDEDGKLVGIVTVDDIIDVVLQEANEDIGKLSASAGSIDFSTTSVTASLRRLPWLILLLFLGLLSGNIISHFEDTLDKVVALAFFMPMIAGMTGNTGTQSLAVVVRGLVSAELDRLAIFRLIMREFGVGLIIGATCGTLIALIAYFWQGNAILGLVVGASLFFTLIIGTLAGTIIPLALYRLKLDPAVASGPLITTLNDVFSLLVYFGTASMFLSHLS